MQVPTQIGSHTHTHARTQTYTHTHTHEHTHMNTHSHTHAPRSARARMRTLRSSAHSPRYLSPLAYVYTPEPERLPAAHSPSYTESSE